MPAPSDRPPRSRRALLWTSTTYFGEGLPWSFLHQMVTEFLTAIRASSTQIGATSALHLAVTFKFAWSPILDLFGKRRTWLLALQVVLGLGMFVVAAIAPSQNLTRLWVAVAVLAVVHATHDIACDGFYLQALDRREQALFSGTRLGAYRLALLVGNSLLVVLAGATNWLLGFGAAGVLMLVTAAVNAAVMPHPPEEKVPRAAADGAAGKARAFLEAFASFITQPQAPLVLSFMLLYRVGDIMMFAMSKPLLRDLGVDTQHRGLLNGVGGVVSIFAVVIGGAIVARRSLGRTLVPMIYLQNLAIPLYLAMAIGKPRFSVIMSIVIIEQLVSGFGMAAASVFIMQRCKRAFSASHFAMSTSLVSVAATFFGIISGRLDDRFGHPLFFGIACLASVPSLILVLFVPKTPLEAEPAEAG